MSRRRLGSDKADQFNPLGPEQTKGTTIMLPERQLLDLDLRCLEIRKQTGVRINRSELLRCATEAVLRARPDLTGVHDKDELCRRFLRCLG
jgi:hypothetical protein